MLLLRKLSCFLLVVFVCCSFSGGSSTKWSPILKNKIDKAITSVYETEDLRYESVIIPKNTTGIAKETLENNFFKLFIADDFKGFIYVAQAPSMKNVFDFLVILSPELEIEKAKILIYREQHGRQIGATRWLNQFKGMTVKDRPQLGKEVDGISGATISAKGMTKAVNDLLVALSSLKEKDLN